MDNLETGISYLRGTRDFSLLICAVFISALGFIQQAIESTENKAARA
jgi:hypothetical protein